MNRNASSSETMTVDLGPRSYDIVVGEGVLADAGRHLQPVVSASGAVVVTDETVAGHWLETLARALDDAAIKHGTITLAPGEGAKDFAHLDELTGQLLAAGIDRGTTLIALGGGVIGDLTGFAAAVTLRGIGFVQAPTTLLAQVDSAVGGKTGINTRHGKNLVGAFHQPKLVLADTGTLETLPKREVLAGYAEVVKYGLIGDAGFFRWLDENGPAVIRGDGAASRHAVLTSCRAKAAIVAEDELEQGRRALLNLGHTFAHALEAGTGYTDTLLHGEAVAIGTVMAFDLSVRMGLCSATERDRVKAHLDAVGLPTGVQGLKDRLGTVHDLIGYMARDKKARAGQLTFILVRGIGDAFITQDVDINDVEAVLAEHLGG